jgi:hypothetical protein
LYYIRYYTFALFPSHVLLLWYILRYKAFLELDDYGLEGVAAATAVAAAVAGAAAGAATTH